MHTSWSRLMPTSNPDCNHRCENRQGQSLHDVGADPLGQDQLTSLPGCSMGAGFRQTIVLEFPEFTLGVPRTDSYTD
jgi:hypothetical protein